MKEKYREAFSEIEQIINLMPSNLTSKIPLEFIQIIQEEKSKNYNPNITEPLEQCKLKSETIIILALIYRDFLCSKEERLNLQARDNHSLNEFEKEIREKYNTDNMFKARKNIQHSQNVSQTEPIDIIEYKSKSFLQKLFDKIKQIFKIK